MCLTNMRSTLNGGVKAPWFIYLFWVNNFFVDPQVLYQFIDRYIEVLSISWTIFWVSCSIEHLKCRTKEQCFFLSVPLYATSPIGQFLDSFGRWTGVSFVVFVWFFSRKTSLETMYFWDSHLAISLSDSLPALHVRESETDSKYWIPDSCQWNLDSGFQLLEEFWIPWPQIPDFKTQDSKFHRQKFPNSLSRGKCRLRSV